MYDANGDRINPELYLEGALSGIDTGVSNELQSRERRLPQRLKLTIDPDNKKAEPLRADLSNTLAANGLLIEKNKPMYVEIDKKNQQFIIGGAVRTKGGAQMAPQSIPFDMVPQSLKNRFNLLEEEWHYNAQNPTASTVTFNYKPFNDFDKSYSHFENLVDGYKLGTTLDVNQNNIEQRRRQYAPTKTEIYNDLLKRYPTAPQEEVSALVDANYRIKYEPKNGQYQAVIYDNNNKKLRIYNTGMTNFDEGLAAANTTIYLVNFLKEKIQDAGY